MIGIDFPFKAISSEPGALPDLHFRAAGGSSLRPTRGRFRCRRQTVGKGRSDIGYRCREASRCPQSIWQVEYGPQTLGGASVLGSLQETFVLDGNSAISKEHAIFYPEAGDSAAMSFK